MKFWSILKKLLLIGMIALIIIATAYFLFVRPWIMRMGTTKDEVSMTLPGDTFVVSPSANYTQAITINAPKEYVWGYIIQMGHKRGGWYNWDSVNRMADKEYFYENNKSADRIIPELQNLQQSDTISLAPMIPPFEVTELKKNEHMLLSVKDSQEYRVTWVYSLKEIDKNTTRLLVRWHANTSKDFVSRLFDILITEPGGAGVQQSLNMRGIKLRAERDFNNGLK